MFSFDAKDLHKIYVKNYITGKGGRGYPKLVTKMAVGCPAKIYFITHKKYLKFLYYSDRHGSKKRISLAK